MHERLRALAVSMLLLVLSACASVPNVSVQIDPLVGCWYGEDFQPVLQRKAAWLMNRRADGSFTIEFATVGQGKQLRIQVEEGRWSHENDTYTTVTTKVGGESLDTIDPQFTDVYEITLLADGVMSYYHPKMKMAFTSKKVSCVRSDA
jgi:hypothetical protein